MSATPRICVVGRTGQLGRALARELAGRNAVFLGRDALDLSEPITELPEADGVILAAAYTAVDRAESESALATRVNAEAVGDIAGICAERGIPLVHVSTDYVFSGVGDTPWKPEDPVAPTNAYGRSKLGGEAAIAESGATAAVLRTSWVFDGTGRNFLTTMLRLSETRSALSIVGDQVGRPTYAGHLAKACVVALDALHADPSNAGIYHVSNSGEAISWADFAAAIFEAADRNVTVTPIPSSDYPTPASRPLWSVMDTDAFTSRFEHPLPHWRDGLAAAMAERDDTHQGDSS